MSPAHRRGSQGHPEQPVPYGLRSGAGRCVRATPTPDGTGVRDYIHVVGLGPGHVAALDWMAGRVGTGEPIGVGSVAGAAAEDGTRRGVGIFNLGTGKGSSVLDVIHAFEAACGHEIPYRIMARRPATSRSATPTPRRPATSWAGRPNTTWPACAKTAGAGSPRTPTATGTRNRRRELLVPISRRTSALRGQ